LAVIVKKIAADKAGLAVTDRGFINIDIPMGTNVPSFPGA
jgi:dihydrolipoamide dehydrogenase